MTRFLCTYALTIVLIFIWSITDHWYKDFDFTPKQIYKSVKLNMFGCCVLWLIFFILNPILFICKFIGWIFTVGRKDKDE
jgi:hypothetical protein